MASSEDYKTLYELYQVEGVPKGISIVDFCQRNGLLICKCPKFEVIANLEVESVVNTFAVIIHLKLSHYGNDRLRKRV